MRGLEVRIENFKIQRDENFLDLSALLSHLDWQHPKKLVYRISWKGEERQAWKVPLLLKNVDLLMNSLAFLKNVRLHNKYCGKVNTQIFGKKVQAHKYSFSCYGIQWEASVWYTHFRCCGYDSDSYDGYEMLASTDTKGIHIDIYCSDVQRYGYGSDKDLLVEATKRIIKAVSKALSSLPDVKEGKQ